MEPLSPITMDVRLWALGVTVLLSVVVVGLIMYARHRESAQPETDSS